MLVYIPLRDKTSALVFRQAFFSLTIV